jgi:hypothetical protein
VSRATGDISRAQEILSSWAEEKVRYIWCRFRKITKKPRYMWGGGRLTIFSEIMRNFFASMEIKYHTPEENTRGYSGFFAHVDNFITITKKASIASYYP